jgi:hypothetical protein
VHCRINILGAEEVVLARVRRFFGKPKKTMFFENRNYSMLLLEENRKKPEKTKKSKNRGEMKKPRRKIGILIKSNHTYTSLLQMAFPHEKL